MALVGSLRFECLVETCHTYSTPADVLSRGTLAKTETLPYFFSVQTRILEQVRHLNLKIDMIWVKLKCSFHISVSFLKIYGFSDFDKFQYLGWEQLRCLCIMYPAFMVLEKLSWE